MDNKLGFTWHFFDGQRVIADLSTLHSLEGAGFTYYRDLVLSSLPMISFLKAGEQLGLYIDSESPYFQFKIEANASGQFRTLILPHHFNKFPDRLKGICRYVKIMKNSKPYNSILELKQTSTKDIINNIIENSYQLEARSILSEMTDQSLQISKIPLSGSNLNSLDIELDNYIKNNNDVVHDLFEKDFNDIEKIVSFLERKNLTYLSSNQIDFFCGCSKENMITGLQTLVLADQEELFQNENHIHVNCDYCHKSYQISKSEI